MLLSDAQSKHAKEPNGFGVVLDLDLKTGDLLKMKQAAKLVK